MSPNHNNPIREKVMSAIKSGRVAMRPRWHFVLQIALFATGGVLALGALLYLATFVLFSLHQSGAWFGPGFGARGWIELLRELPWIVIFLAILFITLLEVLVRNYAFGYRKPLLYSTLAIVAVIVVGGVTLAHGPLNDFWLRNARYGHPPFPGSFYGHHGFHEPRGIHQGTIVSISPSGFVMGNALGATSTVLLSDDIPSSLQLAPGEHVAVLGPLVDTSTIRAVAIRVIPE